MDGPEQTRISVIDPISDAIERTKFILFTPFNIAKWFIIGFCAFLAGLNFTYGGMNLIGSIGDFQDQGILADHMDLFIIIGAIAVVIVCALIVLFYWLSSRGLFMFLHCVAKNVMEVKNPWTTFKNEANSLFLFRLSVGVLTLITSAIFGVGIFLSAILIKDQDQLVLGISLVVFLSLVLLSILSIVGVLIIFTKDFIVPIMYLQRCRCLEAWWRFWPVITSNKGKFTLYIHFKMVILLAIVILIGILFAVTCCIAHCITNIPYIGSVFLLPFSFFIRSYSLYYLRQFSTQYDVFEELEQVLYD